MSLQPYLEYPSDIAMVEIQRYAPSTPVPAPEGYVPCRLNHPEGEDLFACWKGDKSLPLLVSIELEESAFAPLTDLLPWPIERVGLVNEVTALYRRLDV